LLPTIEKTTIERKSLVKQQILMYKTAVYRLVNGSITHQKQQISENRWYCTAVRTSTLTLSLTLS